MMNAFYRQLWSWGVWLLPLPALLADPLDVWHQRSTNVLQNLTYGNGLFVGVGSGGRIMTSPTGESWTQQNSSSEPIYLKAVTYGDGLFVAVGADGSGTPLGAFIFTSPDATNWTRQVVPSGPLLGVAFGNGRFVAVAQRQSTNDPNVLLSFNGVTWQPYSFAFVDYPGAVWPYPGSMLASVAYGNGVFVAVGSLHDSIWVSANGSVWVNQGQSSRQKFAAVTWGNGRFVAVGSENMRAVSTNGTDWTWATNSSEYFPASGVGFGNGTFIAAGYAGIFSSRDGFSWTRRTEMPPYSSYYHRVVYGNGTFVALGLRGIIQSENMITPQLARTGRATDTGFPLRISGEVGRGYRLQASTNLVNWDTLWSYTNSDPTVDYTDSSAPNRLRRFYRAVTP